jgi:tetratricopeptide (TPR) repeat protein
MFREELKNQGEEEDDEEVLRDSQGIIYEDEVCECCGERRRAKNSEYCKVCQEAMRKYPLSLPMIIVAAVVVFFAVFSVFDFSYNFDGYYSAYRAKNAENKKEMFSAIDFYEESIQLFSLNGVNAKRLRFECADVMCVIMADPADIITTISSAIEDYEAMLPIYNKRIAQYDEMYVFNKTMEMAYEIANEYGPSVDEDAYEEAMTAIGALIDQEIVVPSLDGEPRRYKCNEAAVRYYQYLYAYYVGNSTDVYYYVHETYKVGPQYLGLYGPDLCVVSVQTGDFKLAVEIAEAIHEDNVENSTYYYIHSIVERLKGNYDAAIQWTDDGLAINTADTELMRNKAMAYICKGDAEKASEVINEAVQYGYDENVLSVMLIIENELGNTERVTQLKEKIEEMIGEVYGKDRAKLPTRVQEYLDGKLTAVQVFTEGTGDV